MRNVFFLPPHFDSGTPDHIRHPHTYLPIWISQQRLAEELWVRETGLERRRQNFIWLTNSWDCGQNPASELACALCTSSLLFKIFKSKVPNEKKRKKIILGKYHLILNVMTRNSCVNDPNMSICSHQWSNDSNTLSLACPPVPGVLGSLIYFLHTDQSATSIIHLKEEGGNPSLRTQY